MTLQRRFSHILLSPQDLPGSHADLEVVGSFNPAAIRVNQEVVLLIRVAERPSEKRQGMMGLPRWDPIIGLIIDWIPLEDLEFVDARVVRSKTDGLIRLTSLSHLRVAYCGDGTTVRTISDITFRPESHLEEFGVEDPRITQLNDRFYFTYVAVSRHGPATALASTLDFRTFERHGIIFCPENKDVVLFPEMISGQYAALHRPVCGSPFTQPEMWLASSPDLLHWGQHQHLAIPHQDWQSGRIGAGPPPIRVPGGFLSLYHGNRSSKRSGEVGEYAAGALLLDANDPSRVLTSTTEPFLRPELEFEQSGFVANVVFPTGTVIDGEQLLVYYGAADTVTAVAAFDLGEFIAAASHSQ